jgi:hypothetical protein
MVVCITNQVSVAQSVFTTQSNGRNRAYLGVQSRGAAPNQPLIIITHSNQSTALRAFGADSFWKQMRVAATIIFPIATNNEWNCDSAAARNDDLAFFMQIIEEAYQNYRIDRNRVFIILQGDTHCLGQQISDQVSGIVHTNDYPPAGRSLINRCDSLASVPGNVKFALWSKQEAPGVDPVEIRIDSIRRKRWDKRWSVELGSGTFFMLPSVKTNVDDKTYMDISDSRRQLDVTATKWMNDSMGWFLNLTWLRVPQKQELKVTYQGSGILLKGEGGGGAVIPLTLGFKYALRKGMSRPYVIFGTGITSVIVLGGKFKTTSINIDPTLLKSNVESEVRLTTHVVIGSGYDWRLGKHIVVTGQLTYMHSSKFESAGQINAVRGVALNLQMGWIFGVNKID